MLVSILQEVDYYSYSGDEVVGPGSMRKEVRHILYTGNTSKKHEFSVSVVNEKVNSKV